MKPLKNKLMQVIHSLQKKKKNIKNKNIWNKKNMILKVKLETTFPNSHCFAIIFER